MYGKSERLINSLCSMHYYDMYLEFIPHQGFIWDFRQGWGGGGGGQTQQL
jgi:hypothetical protein